MSRLHQIDDDQVVQRFFDHDYRDRGIVKWQGFHLSDHTAALKKQAKQEAQRYPAKPHQSLAEISRRLNQAFANHLTVSIQMGTRDANGQYQPDLVGKVRGYQDELIYLDQHEVVMENIRHVAFIDGNGHQSKTAL